MAAATGLSAAYFRGEGDKDDFFALVTRHTRWLYAYAHACFDGPEIDDLVRDVLMRACADRVIAECCNEDKCIEAYLLESMVNAVMDEHRRRAAEGESFAGRAASLLTRMFKRDARLRYDYPREIDWLLHCAIRALPARCQAAFIMIRLLHKPYTVAAEALHMSVKTLDAHLCSATVILRQQLAAAGWCPRPDPLDGADERTR